MPEDVTFLPKDDLLTFEEIARLVGVAAGLGVTKVRLTGGEPLLRRDLHKLVGMLVAIPGLTDIGLTTNGLLLKAQAQALRNAGLRRLNVSLDTLDPGRFREVSRRDGIDQVLDGLAAAKGAGFDRIKVNAVAIRGVTEADVVPLAAFCRTNGFELRFIEYMPIGADPWERDKVLPAADMLQRLEAAFGPLVAPPDADPHAPALEFNYADGGGRVGIIASVTRPFCKQSTGCGSPPTGNYATACSRSTRPTSALSSARPRTTRPSRWRFAESSGTNGRGTRSTRPGSSNRPGQCTPLAADRRIEWLSTAAPSTIAVRRSPPPRGSR